MLLAQNVFETPEIVTVIIFAVSYWETDCSVRCNFKHMKFFLLFQKFSLSCFRPWLGTSKLAPCQNFRQIGKFSGLNAINWFASVKWNWLRWSIVQKPTARSPEKTTRTFWVVNPFHSATARKTRKDCKHFHTQEIWHSWHSHSLKYPDVEDKFVFLFRLECRKLSSSNCSCRDKDFPRLSLDKNR